MGTVILAASRYSHLIPLVNASSDGSSQCIPDYTYEHRLLCLDFDYYSWPNAGSVLSPESVRLLQGIAAFCFFHTSTVYVHARTASGSRIIAEVGCEEGNCCQ